MVKRLDPEKNPDCAFKNVHNKEKWSTSQNTEHSAKFSHRILMNKFNDLTGLEVSSAGIELSTFIEENNAHSL